jgi:hypothetical protein
MQSDIHCYDVWAKRNDAKEEIFKRFRSVFLLVVQGAEFVRSVKMKVQTLGNSSLSTVASPVLLIDFDQI